MECAAIPDAANPACQLAERPREESIVGAAAQIAHQGVRLPGACRGKAGQDRAAVSTNATLKMAKGDILLQYFVEYIRPLHAAWTAGCAA